MELSNKRGPRMDDDLKSPARGGEDAKIPESALEAEPRPPDAIPEVEDRSELARYLDPSAFPARSDELIERATSHRAPDYLLDRLRGLPDRQFETIDQVWDATRAAS